MPIAELCCEDDLGDAAMLNVDVEVVDRRVVDGGVMDGEVMDGRVVDVREVDELISDARIVE